MYIALGVLGMFSVCLLVYVLYLRAVVRQLPVKSDFWFAAGSRGHPGKDNSYSMD